jgi:hypothetical protein
MKMNRAVLGVVILIALVVASCQGPTGPGSQNGGGSGGGNASEGPVPDIAKLLAEDGAADDRFGWSVALSGDYAIVGAIDDEDNGTNSGSAYVFRRTGPATWDDGTKLLPLEPDGVTSDGAPGDQFGSSVAISGDYAIVGVSLDDDNGTNSGSAYVFRRTGGTDPNTWDTGTKLLPLAPDGVTSDGEADDQFGLSVSISGDYAIVGSPYDNGEAGSAYVFRRTGTNTWDAGTKLAPSGPSTNRRFGFSVGIDGNYAVGGAPNDNENGAASGSAYVFRRTGGTEPNTWDTGTKLLPLAPDGVTSDGAASDRFGWSVAIGGDYAIVGAPYNDDNGSNTGSAYSFHRTAAPEPNTWAAGAKLLPMDVDGGDLLGESVAIGGDYAVVGAKSDNENGSNAGSAYVFRRTGVNAWDAGSRLTPSDNTAGDFLGRSVAVSGDFAIVSASNDDDNGSDSGSAYEFSLLP